MQRAVVAGGAASATQVNALRSSAAARSRYAANASAALTSPAPIASASCLAVMRTIRAVSPWVGAASLMPAGWGRGSRPRCARAPRPAPPRDRGRARLVGPQRVGDVDDVRGRLDALEVELRDALDVLEDVRELAGHALHLAVAELQAREAGDVQDLLAIDHRLGEYSGRTAMRMAIHDPAATPMIAARPAHAAQPGSARTSSSISTTIAVMQPNAKPNTSAATG